MIRIAALGDNVVDCYVSKGEMFPGGNCLNVAVWSRRFGAISAYIGAIGTDRPGDVIYEALTDESVDVSHLRRVPGSTAYCLISHKNGDRIFQGFDLGVSMFTPSNDDFSFLSTFNAVHVGQSSGLDGYLDRAAKATLLSYDFSVRSDAVKRKLIAPICFLASVSGSSLSAAEAAGVGQELLSSGAKWALVTRGSEGATLTGPQGHFTVKSMPIEPIDTLGAGDAFIARTLYGLLAGESPKDTLQAAACAAAETCQDWGAIGHGATLSVPALTAGAALPLD